VLLIARPHVAIWWEGDTARAITSVCVAECGLVLAAGALICLEIDGLSPLTRTRLWQPPFTRTGLHEPTAPKAPKAS
jgi:hypothetical protein